MSDAACDSSDSDSDDLFIENATSRTKAHSKRAGHIYKKVKAIDQVTRPYVLLYISRYVLDQSGNCLAYSSIGFLQSRVGLSQERSGILVHIKQPEEHRRRQSP